MTSVKHDLRPFSKPNSRMSFSSRCSIGKLAPNSLTTVVTLIDFTSDFHLHCPELVTQLHLVLFLFPSEGQQTDLGTYPAPQEETQSLLSFTLAQRPPSYLGETCPILFCG